MNRRDVIKIVSACFAGMSFFQIRAAHAAEASERWIPSQRDAMTVIHTRRSVRQFTEKTVTDEQIHALLAAAMCAPSAGNEQPWEFIAIKEKSTLVQVGSINKYAGYADSAPLAIMVCLNTTREKFPGNGVLDTAAATQNILLAAHAMGLGAVWTGVYPEKNRMAAFSQLLGLPEHVLAMNLVIIGYPAKETTPQDRFDKSRIHVERW